MSAPKDFVDTNDHYVATIKVAGVGGGGVNAINRMADAGIEGVELIALNTDIKQLAAIEADVMLNIGEELTNGLGAGGNPEIGRQAAEESEEEIRDSLQGAQMVIIATGEGGGTGTGAAPVVARVARELGCLTIAVVTKPFEFEGKLKMKRALEGIEEIKKYVDSLIVIPNERLIEYAGAKMEAMNAFAFVDEILMQSVRAITDIIIKNGYFNVDFNDVQTVLKDSKTAIIGIGEAEGDDRIIQAIDKAINSPLLESHITGAKGATMVLYGAEHSLTMNEYQQAGKYIGEQIDEYAEFKPGLVYDDTLGEKVRVVIIASGFDEVDSEFHTPSSSPVASDSANTTTTAKGANYTHTDLSNMHPLGDGNDDDNNVSEPSSTDIPDFMNANSSPSTSGPSANSGSIAAVSGSHPIVSNSESVFSSDRNATIAFPVSGAISSAANSAVNNSPFNPVSGNIPTISDPHSDSSDQEDSLELPDFME